VYDHKMPYVVQFVLCCVTCMWHALFRYAQKMILVDRVATADTTMLLFLDSDSSFDGGRESPPNPTKATRKAWKVETGFPVQREVSTFHDVVLIGSRGETVQAMVNDEYGQWHDKMYTAWILQCPSGDQSKKRKDRN